MNDAPGGMPPFLLDKAAADARLRHEWPLFGGTVDELKQLYVLAQRRLAAVPRPGWLASLLEPERVLLFIGQARSGHSLLGAMIDAHPDAVIAHEMDLAAYVRARFSPDQIFYLAWENSRHCARSGRVWGKYAYAVPDGWQGRVRTLRVIGDKKGGSTTDHIAQFPDLPAEIETRLGRPVSFIHVVRNPYDNLATLAGLVDAPDPMAVALERYRRRLDPCRMLGNRAPDRLLTIHLDDLLADTDCVLGSVADRLGLVPEKNWIAACSAIVRKTPSRTGRNWRWTKDQLETVASLIAETPFLQRYAGDGAPSPSA